MSEIPCDPLFNTPTDRPVHDFVFQHAIHLLGLPDPRNEARYDCGLKVLYQTVTVQVPSCGLGEVVDLSRNGAGLWTRRPVDPGDFVVIRPNYGCITWQPLLLRVTHMRQLPWGGFRWGGAWLGQLSSNQLGTMLDYAAS